MEQRVQLDAEKNRMFMQIMNARNNMRTVYLARELNIPISHNREMIAVLKFKVSSYFRIFVVK